jgi:DNA-binding response OmpR family regulator
MKRHAPGLPVVILAGSGKKDVIRQNSHVVDRVITKPFTLAEIDTAIENFSVRTTSQERALRPPAA